MKTIKQANQLLSTAELAKALNVSMMTLHYWRKKGFPHIKFSRRTIRYDPVAVVKYFEDLNRKIEDEDSQEENFKLTLTEK